MQPLLAEPLAPSSATTLWRVNLVAASIAVAIFAGLSVVCAIAGRGFLEADAATHYLYARFALAEPHYFTNVWGRPLCTGLYAIPAALLGRLGVRLMSLVLALVCGLGAYSIARRQRHRWPALALVFTLGMPLVFLHSFSELTELPFAAVFTIAFIAYQRRWWVLMAFSAGLLPLGRPEGFGFVLLAGAALMAHRRWPALMLLPVPLLLWDYSGWVLCGYSGPWWRWIIDNWPYSANSVYDRGYLLHFVALLPMLASPLVFPMMCIGIWRALAADEPNEPRVAAARRSYLHELLFDGHERRVTALTALLPLMVLVVHSLLHWLGKMASNGELRYLLVVAPLWGVLSASGWEWVTQKLRWNHPLALAGAAVLLPIGVNYFYRAVPTQPDAQWRYAQQVADTYRRSDLWRGYPRIMASHPAVFYYLDVSITDQERTSPWTLETARAAPKGTVLLWDPMYARWNASQEKSVHLEDITAAGWIPADELLPPQGSQDQTERWHAFLSPRTQSGRAR